MSDCAAVKTRLLVLGMIEKACVVFVFFLFFSDFAWEWLTAVNNNIWLAAVLINNQMSSAEGEKL